MATLRSVIGLAALAGCVAGQAQSPARHNGFAAATHDRAVTTAESSTCVVDLPAAHGLQHFAATLTGLSWRGWDELCRDLALYLRTDAPARTAQGGAEAAALLLEIGYFESAACAASEGGRGLECRLAPARIVRDVAIGGEVPFALLRESIRRRVFLRPGVVLQNGASALDSQARRLGDYLTDEGYFGSRVSVRTRVVAGAEPNLGTLVEAELRPGETARLREVWIEGDLVLPPERLEAELAHPWLFFLGNTRFRPAQFRQDLTRIAEIHREHGWPEARVSGDFFLDRRARAVDVVVRVDAGAKLVLRFTGNRALDDGDLAELATFTDAGIIDAVEMERTREAIVAAYQKKGYYAPEVSYEIGNGVPHERVITYHVREGPRAAITLLSFRGNNSFSAAAIRDRAELATTPSGLFAKGYWVDEWVARDELAIAALYARAGFHDTAVRTTKRQRTDGSLAVEFEIEEGTQRLVVALTLDRLPAGIDSAALRERLDLTEGAPFVPAALDGDQREVLAVLAAAGYIHADVSQDVIPLATDRGSVLVRYEVRAGPRARFGGLFVRGNFRTRRSLIEDTLGLAPGEPLDLVAVGRARRRLRDLGIFGSVELQPLGASRPTAETWLLTALQERDARAFDIVTSFATDELFSIGLDYVDANLLGRAIRFEAQVRTGNAGEAFGEGCGESAVPGASTGIDLRCGRIGNRDLLRAVLRAPRPFGLLIDVEGTGVYDFQDKPVYRERRVGATLAVLRAQNTPDVTTELGYELLSTDFRARQADARSLPRAPNSTIARLVPRFAIDRQDSFTDPRRGFRFELRLELAHRILAGRLPEAASFVRGITSAAVYRPLADAGRWRLTGGRLLGGPVVAALSASAGAAEPWAGERSLPPSEYFYYGGDQSVRGLPERASTLACPRAQYLLTSSIELRWYLWQNLGIGSLQLAAFGDAGAVGTTPADLLAGTTVTLGGALRYVTPVGPISLAYAKPIHRVEQIPTGGRFHFSFGYTF